MNQAWFVSLPPQIRLWLDARTTAPPRVGRYEATSVLSLGSRVISAPGVFVHPTPSSLVWLGHDLETGAPVVLKAYDPGAGLSGLYENELSVHREMLACDRFARLLDADEERQILVKSFVDGDPTSPSVGRGGNMQFASGFSTMKVRELLADVLSCVAFAARVGRLADHALGGWGETYDVRGSTIEWGSAGGAAEPNVLVGAQGAIAVDLCNLGRGRWSRQSLIGGTVLRALWFHRSSLKPHEALLADHDQIVPGDRRRAPTAELFVVRMRMLRSLDEDLHDVIVKYGDCPIALSAAVSRLAGRRIPTRDQLLLRGRANRKHDDWWTKVSIRPRSSGGCA